jgi:hypothetical protein
VIIAFLAGRKGYLKVMGSLIQAAVDRRHPVVLLRDPTERKPGEATTDADLRPWPGARVVVHRRGEPLLPVLRGEGVQALVGPSLYHALQGTSSELPQMRGSGVRLYSVDYAFETLTSDPDAYRVLDRTFYMSEFQRRLHWDVLRDRFARVAREVSLEARSAVSGSTMLDQLALVNDRAAVRRKYGLPADRPVVLFMSLKMDVGDGPRRDRHRKYVWGSGSVLTGIAKATAYAQFDLIPDIWRGNDYRALAESVRDFCRRNGAALVVKSRAKNRDPGFLRGLADVFVERDEDVFPYASMELMAVADLCVHFQSGAVLEAAFCGVPSLSVKVMPPYDPAELPGYQETWGGAPGSLQNFAGIVWSTDPKGARPLLEGRALGDFKVDPEARHAYVEKYLGYDDTRSSQRVLDAIEQDARVSAPAAARPA